MIIKKYAAFIIFIGMLYGCSAATFTIIEINPETGKEEKVKYSQYFTTKDVLLEDKLKVYAKVSLKKKRIPVVEKLKKKDAHDPLLDISPAVIELYFSNVSKKNVIFSLDSVEYVKGDYTEAYLTERRDIVLVPFSAEKIIIEDRDINIYDREVTLILGLKVGGQNYLKKLSVKRLTKEEYKKEK